MDKTDKTIESYDKNAETYANKFMNYQQYKEKIIEFCGVVKEKDRILDLGCGPGNVMNYIKGTDKKNSFVGVDMSSEMIKIAKRNVSEAKFYCQDIRTFEISENEFDVVLMPFCIVHLFEEEAKEVIKKVSKMLKKNGKFYISFKEGRESGYETTSFSKDEIYFNYFSSKLIEGELFLVK